MAHVRLFISCVSKEFLSYREGLRSLLQRPDVTVQVQEDFIAGVLPTLDKLDDYIRNCDGVIHVVGDMTGASALRPSIDLIAERYPDFGTSIPELAPTFRTGIPAPSYTQWEAYLAIYHRKALLIAKPAEGAKREMTHVREPAQQAAQRDHLVLLQGHERFAEVTFLDDRDLALAVYRSPLHGALVRAGVETIDALFKTADIAAERRHNELLEAIAREKGVDPKDLIPILENLGYQGLSIAPNDIPRLLRESIDAIRDVAEQPLVRSNSGEDIERVRRRSRDALRDAKTDEAVAILDRQLEAEREAMEDRRRRAIVLLQDKAQVERLRYDHAAARATLREIIRLDPDSAWAWGQLGREWVTAGSLLDATEAIQGALSAARRTGDAPNEGAALDNFGDVLVAQGNLDDALKSFRDSLAIRDRLAKQDPGNAGWQRDRSVSYNKVGDVLVQQGNLDDALKSFRDSLAIIDRLAKADPGNASWRADLAASHGKLGQLQAMLGNRDEALRLFKAGRAIVAPFAEQSGHQLWIGYLRSFDAAITALEP